MPAAKDYSGQVVNGWVVEGLSRICANKKRYWVNCPSCNKRIERTIIHLNTTTCCNACAGSKRFIDLTGRTFGQWRVLSFSHKAKTNYHWNCECSCKRTQTTVSYANLIRGASTKCVLCDADNYAVQMRKDWTGQTFHMLTFIRLAPEEYQRRGKGAYWVCVCACDKDKELIIEAISIVHHSKRSCGCIDTLEARSIAMRNGVSFMDAFNYMQLEQESVAVKDETDAEVEMASMRAKEIPFASKTFEPSTRSPFE
jgi:hypothetical protein